MLFLFEIEDVFELAGRGCVLVPGVPYSFGEVRVGARIVVETPFGARIETEIKAFEMINRGRLMERAPFSLPSNIRKDQLPIGSSVFLGDGENICSSIT